MIKHLFASCLICVFGVGVALAQDKEKADFDAKKLLGDWNYAKGVKAGVASGEEMMAGIVTVSEKTFTLPGGEDMKFVMAYKIDASKSPAQIDFTIEEGPVPDGKAIGIIQIKDGQIVLCYDPNGQERPKKFESTESNGCHLFVLKKAKKDD